MILPAATPVLTFVPGPVPPPQPVLTLVPSTEQPPATQKPPQTQHPVAEGVLIAALAAWLAGGALWAGARIPKRIMDALKGVGVSGLAVRAVLELIRRGGRPGRVLAPGIAARLVASGEWLKLAAFAMVASRRATTALEHQQALVDALTAERRYFKQYQHAAENRANVADKVDKVAKSSLKMEWQSVMDSRTTKDCWDLNGTIFTVDDPPNGIYPGMMHPNCRCKPVPVKE